MERIEAPIPFEMNEDENNMTLAQIDVAITSSAIKAAMDISKNVWHKEGDIYHPGSTAQNAKTVEPGIYKFVMTQRGWYLEKTNSRYTFPYKIYGMHNKIVRRIEKTWDNLPSNFGILLNGLKGTGKTITAQQLVNWAIDRGIAVVNVTDPVPLDMILNRLEQDVLVLFDEFEKTHSEETAPGSQQRLLSTIDGLSRSLFRRMFVFTTNDKKINQNFLDRPSRIRYSWSFDRLEDSVIQEVMDDRLNRAHTSKRAAINAFLQTREVLTIDTVKAVIDEVNIFGESPEEFKSFMNLTEREPYSYKLQIIEAGGVMTTIAEYYKPNHNASFIQSMMTPSGQRDFAEKYTVAGQSYTFYSGMGQQIRIIAPTDNVDEWVCNVQMPSWMTWADKAVGKIADYLWLDERPNDWKKPEWARKKELKEELNEDEENAYGNWIDNETVYGGKVFKKVVVKFSPVKELNYTSYRDLAF